MDTQELGRFAKEQRREAGLSQHDVALLADVPERCVRAFESSKGSVHLDKAISILFVVGFDPGDAATSPTCSRIAAGCGALRPQPRPPESAPTTPHGRGHHHFPQDGNSAR